jgi:hypothetical protein
MKTFSVTMLLCLCFAAGLTNAGQAAGDLNGRGGAATPRVVYMTSIPDARGLQSKTVMELPSTYDLAQTKASQSSGKAPVESGSSSAASSIGPDVYTPYGNTPPPPPPPLHIGTNFNGPVQNGYIPYSAAVAVGPSHIVVMSNAQFAIYTKTGTLLSLKQNNQFFPTDAGVSRSPKCYYDAASGHFVMLAAQAQNPMSFMNVAVSQTSDPTGAWWMYHLDWTLDGSAGTSNWGDWPTLGYSDSALYIAANQFSFANIYQYSKVRVLSKSQLFTGAVASWQDFTNLRNADGTSAFCLNAARALSSSASGYLLNNVPAGGSTVTVWRIDNAPSSPTLTRVATPAVGAYALPPDARQPGRGAPYVTTGDCRLQNVVLQGGMLYTAFSYNAGSKAGSGIKYLNISTSGAVSKSLVFSGAAIDYYYPAVTVDPTGNMFMVFSRSSTSEYPSMYATGMKTTETAIESPTRVKAGAGLVNNSRWGEYNGIQNDPSNPGAVWMYCGWEQSNNTWGSYVASASFGLAPVTQPVGDVQEAVVRSFALNSNYPNPFNPSTVISYTLPEEGHARLVIYDAVGRSVATLVDDVQTAGEHQVTFNAVGLSSGVYFYRLEAGTNMRMNKMLLAK